VTPYLPQRDSRFYYADDAIQHIEALNCQWGCRRGAKDTLEWNALGPGGGCEILARVAVGDGEPIDELEYDGTRIVCHAREPL
jgi:hypothetical protein